MIRSLQLYFNIQFMKQIIRVSKYSYFVLLSLILILPCQFPATAQQSNWTHFRGSNLDGISEETGIPTTWNDSVNVVWKTRINGKGWSSPVVYGDQVWLTTATEDGKQMFGVCVDFKTGKEIYNIKLFVPDTIYSKKTRLIHMLHLLHVLKGDSSMFILAVTEPLV